MINQRRQIVVFLDGLSPIGDLRHTKVNALRDLQFASGEELSALSPSGRCAVPSVLRPQGGAFKGEL